MGPRKVGKSTFADSIIPKDERVFEINGDTQTLLLGYGNPQWSNREYGPRIPQVTWRTWSYVGKLRNCRATQEKRICGQNICTTLFLENPAEERGGPHRNRGWLNYRIWNQMEGGQARRCPSFFHSYVLWCPLRVYNSKESDGVLDVIHVTSFMTTWCYISNPHEADRSYLTQS